VTIDLGAVGLQYDGIGGITSNGECRMLYDYPTEIRDQILDYLFLPSFGLSSQILKVEIGSDAQSTVGTEPAYQHERGIISYERGIQFWFLQEAKKRNPSIVIAALEWSAPGWVGNGTFFSDENIKYILGWMHGAEKVYGVRVDYVGVWNEPPIKFVPPDWLAALRKGLDGNGYAHTKVIAPDWAPTGGVTLTLLKDMVARQDVRNAVDIIGTHGFWDSPPADFTTLMENSSKRAWVSESWHQMGTWLGAMGMVNKVIDAHLQGNYSGWTAWGLIFAAYPNVLCQDKGLMYATNPWGPTPSYNVQPTIFTTAHFTQFTKVGWRFIKQGHGSGLLGESGGSFVSLVSTKAGGTANDFSIVVNAFDLKADVLNISFTVAVPSSFALSSTAPARLQVWTSSEEALFVRGKDIPLTLSSSSGSGGSGGSGGSSGSATFQLALQQGTVVSLTTLADGEIAKGSHKHSELPTLFPVPHNDSFDAYAVGRSPLYFTDWDGSFSIEHEQQPTISSRTTTVSSTNQAAARAAGRTSSETVPENMVLRQQVLRRPIKWHCTDIDPISLISTGYQNYAVSIRARVEINTTQSYSSSYVSVWARVRRPYHGWCPASSGYSLRIGPTGSWSLQVAADQLKTRIVLAQGAVQPFDPSAWQELTLACLGNKITATVNGRVVADMTDVTLDSGSAALGSGFHYAAFDDFSITALAPTPEELAPGHKLAAFSIFTGVKLEREQSGWFGFAFTVLKPSLAVSHLARFAVTNSTRTHLMRLVMVGPNTTGSKTVMVANATVDMGAAHKELDALGFVYSQLSPAVELVANQQYYLVAEETAGGDPFYALADAQPCIGHAGVGGTLPRMNVPTDAIRIDGGVGTNSQAMDGGWSMYPDFEPRSFGPVTLLFQDQ
jgi:hypothetical protein